MRQIRIKYTFTSKSGDTWEFTVPIEALEHKAQSANPLYDKLIDTAWQLTKRDIIFED